MIRTLIVTLLALMAFSQDALAVYDPGTGRFITRDPAGYVDGMNLYRYGRSSPARYVDPVGRAALEPGNDLPDWAPSTSSPGSPGDWWRNNNPGNGPFPSDSREDCGISTKTDGILEHGWIEWDPYLDENGNRTENGPRFGAGYWPAGWKSWDPDPNGQNTTLPSIVIDEDGRVTGFGDPKTGSDAKISNPVRRRFGGTLPDGTSCRSATCAQIRDCIAKHDPNSPYSIPSSDCKTELSRVMKKCCLQTAPKR